MAKSPQSVTGAVGAVVEVEEIVVAVVEVALNAETPEAEIILTKTLNLITLVHTHQNLINGVPEPVRTFPITPAPAIGQLGRRRLTVRIHLTVHGSISLRQENKIMPE